MIVILDTDQVFADRASRTSRRNPSEIHIFVLRIFVSSLLNLEAAMYLILLLLFGMANLANAQVDSLWSRTYGGAQWDECYSIVESSDGGYLLAGRSGSYGAGDFDFWIVKTDADGDSMWSRTFGRSARDECHSIIRSEDGCYMLAGYSSDTLDPNSDYSWAWVIKVDSDGDSVWSRDIQDGYTVDCADIVQSADGGYVLAGSRRTGLPEPYDFWAAKVNSEGELMWSRAFGGNHNDNCYAAESTLDNGTVLAGSTYSFGAGDADAWLIKLDSNGDSVWSRTFGGSGYEGCAAVQRTLDSGFILAGSTVSEGFYPDSWVLKTTAEGDSVWGETFVLGGWEYFNSVKQMDDGGYAFSGFVHGNGLVTRVAAAGLLLWSRGFGGTESDRFNDLLPTTDGGFVLTGASRSFVVGDYDFWLFKTTPELSADDPFILSPSSFILSNYPNPFNSSTTISFSLARESHVLLSIFDLTGRSVATIADGMMASGLHQVDFNAAALPSGIYVYRLSANGISQGRKLVLLK
jgi:hypothetical protein